MTRLLTAVAVVFAVVSVAMAVPAPSARVGKVVQRYPWNGIIDVEYRCKDWTDSGYRLVLKVEVDGVVKKVKVDTSSKTGQFCGIKAINLRELFGETRAEAKVTAVVESVD